MNFSKLTEVDEEQQFLEELAASQARCGARTHEAVLDALLSSVPDVDPDKVLTDEEQEVVNEAVSVLKTSIDREGLWPEPLESLE